LAENLTIIARVVAAIRRAEHGSAIGVVGNGGNRRHDSIVHEEHRIEKVEETMIL
jgi:hypothetical protein